jgi:hypothetical protein
MNDWNQIEQQLRSWKPRTASAGLRARVFGDGQGLIESPSPFSGRWTWLAPVMGCFMALLVVSGARNNQLGEWSRTPTTNWLAAVASNQSYAAYISTSFHSEQNSLQQDPIEWTNRPRTSGSFGPVLSANTNSLIH